MSEDGTPRSGPMSPVLMNAAELVGKRWTAAIIWALFHGFTRFSDILAVVPGLSNRLLTERLKELEEARVVERRVIPETPVRIEYRLTPKGDELRDVFKTLDAWATKWTGTPGPAQRETRP